MRVTKIEFEKPEPKKLRVAAYTRVSRDTDNLERSLETQTSYYTTLIKSNPEWAFAGIYTDDGITGTNTEDRKSFQKLIKDCEKGKIDIILTKSISRFARNTVDLINTIRHLSDLGVEVRFDREHINTERGKSEFLISILAAYAQMESASTSQNIRWSVERDYLQGKSHNHRCYGYRWNGKELIPQEDEAMVVRRIFLDCISGLSVKKIAKALNDEGITHSGSTFSPEFVWTILHNERYKGDLLLQKYYSSDFPTLKLKKNHGERQTYYVEGDHEPIVTPETFDKAQEALKAGRYPFSRKIHCKCGRNYVRYDKGKYGHVWRCPSSNMHGGVGINEKDMERLSDGLDYDYIDANSLGTFTFHLKSGETIEKNYARRKKTCQEKLQ